MPRRASGSSRRTRPREGLPAAQGGRCAGGAPRAAARPDGLPSSLFFGFLALAGRKAFPPLRGRPFPVLLLLLLLLRGSSAALPSSAADCRVRRAPLVRLPPVARGFFLSDATPRFGLVFPTRPAPSSPPLPLQQSSSSCLAISRRGLPRPRRRPRTSRPRLPPSGRRQTTQHVRVFFAPRTRARARARPLCTSSTRDTDRPAARRRPVRRVQWRSMRPTSRRLAR